MMLLYFTLPLTLAEKSINQSRFPYLYLFSFLLGVFTLWLFLLFLGRGGSWARRDRLGNLVLVLGLFWAWSGGSEP